MLSVAHVCHISLRFSRKVKNFEWMMEWCYGSLDEKNIYFILLWCIIRLECIQLHIHHLHTWPTICTMHTHPPTSLLKIQGCEWATFMHNLPQNKHTRTLTHRGKAIFKLSFVVRKEKQCHKCKYFNPILSLLWHYLAALLLIMAGNCWVCPADYVTNCPFKTPGFLTILTWNITNFQLYDDKPTKKGIGIFFHVPIYILPSRV